MVVKLSKMLIESGLPNDITKSILGTKCITNLSQGSKLALCKFILKWKLLQLQTKDYYTEKDYAAEGKGQILIYVFFGNCCFLV